MMEENLIVVVLCNILLGLISLDYFSRDVSFYFGKARGKEIQAARHKDLLKAWFPWVGAAACTLHLLAVACVCYGLVYASNNALFLVVCCQFSAMMLSGKVEKLSEKRQEPAPQSVVDATVDEDMDEPAAEEDLKPDRLFVVLFAAPLCVAIILYFALDLV